MQSLPLNLVCSITLFHFIFNIETKAKSSQSYHLKYAHLVGDTQKADAVSQGQKRNFGLVSASSKRDRRTIEETQREMREKKLKKKEL